MWCNMKRRSGQCLQVNSDGPNVSTHWTDFLLSSAYGQKRILQTHIYDQASGRSWTTLGKAYAISHWLFTSWRLKGKPIQIPPQVALALSLQLVTFRPLSVETLSHRYCIAFYFSALRHAWGLQTSAGAIKKSWLDMGKGHRMISMTAKNWSLQSYVSIINSMSLAAIVCIDSTCRGTLAHLYYNAVLIHITRRNANF